MTSVRKLNKIYQKTGLVDIDDYSTIPKIIKKCELKGYINLRAYLYEMILSHTEQNLYYEIVINYFYLHSLGCRPDYYVGMILDKITSLPNIDKYYDKLTNLLESYGKSDQDYSSFRLMINEIAVSYIQLQLLFMDVALESKSKFSYHMSELFYEYANIFYEINKLISVHANSLFYPKLNKYYRKVMRKVYMDPVVYAGIFPEPNIWSAFPEIVMKGNVKVARRIMDMGIPVNVVSEINIMKKLVLRNKLDMIEELGYAKMIAKKPIELLEYGLQEKSYFAIKKLFYSGIMKSKYFREYFITAFGKKGKIDRFILEFYEQCTNIPNSTYRIIKCAMNRIDKNKWTRLLKLSIRMQNEKLVKKIASSIQFDYGPIIRYARKYGNPEICVIIGGELKLKHQ